MPIGTGPIFPEILNKNHETSQIVHDHDRIIKDLIADVEILKEVSLLILIKISNSFSNHFRSV